MEKTAPEKVRPPGSSVQPLDVAKLILFSAVGIFMFFIPVTLGGTSSIPLDHLVTGIRNDLGPAVPYYALLVILLGAVYPFVRGTWREEPGRAGVLNSQGSGTDHGDHARLRFRSEMAL